MMSTPTVYDLAERAGVSIATVSRVYRNPDSVRAATRDRVLAVARDLGCVPSGSARMLLNGQPLTIGDWLDRAPAVLEAWHPGIEAGHAVADVLFGSVNADGELPVTLPGR